MRSAGPPHQGIYGLVALSSECDRAERRCRGPGVDYRDDRQRKDARQIGAAMLPTEKAHHAFDYDQIGFAGRHPLGAGGVPRRPSATVPADVPGHPCQCKPERVTKILAAFEDGDGLAHARSRGPQPGGDSGFALGCCRTRHRKAWAKAIIVRLHPVCAAYNNQESGRDARVGTCPQAALLPPM